MYQTGTTVRKTKASLVLAEITRGCTRVAVLGSKKVIKSAVGRNRIRRRVYEAVRKNFEYLPEKTDYIFVIFSKDILTMPLPELEKLLGELVEESKVCYNR